MSIASGPSKVTPKLVAVETMSTVDDDAVVTKKSREIHIHTYIFYFSKNEVDEPLVH